VIPEAPTELPVPLKHPSAIGGRVAPTAGLVTPRCPPSVGSQPGRTASRLAQSSPGLATPRRGGALLFDLDGVLVNSLQAYAAAWTGWAAVYRVSLAAIATVAHGRRPCDVIRLVRPDLDVALATKTFETLLEGQAAGEVVAAPGAVGLTQSLSGRAWAIATSSQRRHVERTLQSLGIVEPPVLVCGDDTDRGKPDPQCFQLAARRLGHDPAACTVVEDSPAGIQAAQSAGMACVALATTHRVQELSGADGVFASLIDAWDALLDRCGPRSI